MYVRLGYAEFIASNFCSIGIYLSIALNGLGSRSIASPLLLLEDSIPLLDLRGFFRISAGGWDGMKMI